jgi:hypothetical protein
LRQVGFNTKSADLEIKEEVNLMKIARKIALWVSGIVLALFTVFVALQTYYRLTPVALSAEANALLAETAHMAQLTDNGYRMHGLRAPQGVDPIEYGKCYVRSWKKSTDAGQALAGALSPEVSSKAYERNIVDLQQICSQGKPQMPDLKTPADADRIRPGFAWERLVAQANSVPAAVYFDRWNAVLNGGTRGNDPDPITAVFPMYTASLQIERARLAQFAAAWNASETDSQRAKAFGELETYFPKIVEFADGTLIESMISVAATSQYLLVIQSGASKSTSIDSMLSQRMQSSIAAVDQLPRALANAIGAEVHGINSINQRVARVGMGDEVNELVNLLSRFAFDANETLNLMVIGYRESQQHVQDIGLVDGRESTMRKLAENLGCPWLGDLSLICTAFERNATGRVLATIAIPAFTDYGKRVHDVRNLAAGTRLTIEARRRRLQADALAQFVASAPVGMRDVYTGKPFVYDAVKRKLTIELKMKSNVLGEKSYELDL